MPFGLFALWSTIISPKHTLYFLAFATPLSVHLVDERYSTINLSLPTEPLIILVFIGVLLKLLASKRIYFENFRVALSILLLVDFGWLVITAINSSMPLISTKYVLMKSWYIVVFYFLLVKYFKSNQVVKKFLWLFICSVCVLVVYTLWEHGQEGFGRAAAYTAMRPFLPDHGMYAACISFAIPVLFVFAIHGKILGYSSFLRIICWGIFVFLIIAVALSFTRASWVSVAVSLLLYFVLLFKVHFKYILLLVSILVGALFINLDDIQTDLSRNKKESDDNIENHLQSVGNVTSDPSNLERFNRWSCAIRMFEEKPIMGWGPGTYTFQYGQFQLPHQMTIISTNAGKLGGIHSEYLRPLAESGLIGALFYLLIILFVTHLGFKHQRVLNGIPKILSLAAFLGLVTYFAHALLNNYSEFDKIAVPLYSFMAIITAIELNYKNVEEDHQE
ncbi:MAG: O-antigen ligase family protein [Bacteroidia bacterium]|nr:O-antigen ligase family protein [Bacteroidia bacterium]